jgi:hypothetical protein
MAISQMEIRKKLTLDASHSAMFIKENIAHLCTRNKSRTWGKDGWKKVVVCIVADGRKVIHPRVLDW